LPEKYKINLAILTVVEECRRIDILVSKAILDRVYADFWDEPEDLQGVVVFLASDAAAYVNGYTVAVDGAWLSR